MKSFYKLIILLFITTLSTAETIDFGQIVKDAGDDWKKELFSLCRTAKEQVESSPDDQLIYSCIVISHFDNVMEELSGCEEFTPQIKTRLEKAYKAKDDFENGNCPNLSIGFNKLRFKRFKNAKTEEFVVSLPDDFDYQKSVAVFLHPDNRRWAAKKNSYNSQSGFIDIWWHTVENKEIKWKNFDGFMDVINGKIKIDFDRIYVNGECGNGLAAISLALTRSDYWAEASASLGNTYRHMAGNAYNLPLIFVKGGHQEEYLVGYYDFAVNCFEYYNCRFFRHSKPQSTSQLRGSGVPNEVRVNKPLRVIHTIDDYTNPKAYWCEINGRVDENFSATIDAIIWGQKVFVNTENIDSYTLDLLNAPIDANRPFGIFENDKLLGEFTGNEFIKKAEKYKEAKYIKNSKLRGPIADAFTDPYVMVISSQDANEIDLCKKIADAIDKYAEVIPDVNLTDENIKNNNLIMIGSSENNSVLQKIVKELPIDINSNKLIADDIKLNDKDAGVIIIHPNPLNSSKYVAVFTAATQKGLEKLPQVYSKIKADSLTDIAVYDVNQDNSIKLYIREKLDTTWQFHKDRKLVLDQLSQTCPRWKWKQFFAKAVRSQTACDAVIYEDPFTDFDNFDQNNITFRNLCNSVNNSMIVKVSIKGNELRKVMMVPFNDITERKVDAPIIDGIVFTSKQAASDDNISLAQLENEKIYTVAMPERIINGKRMGEVMTDYKIKEFYWQQILLKDFLLNNESIEPVLIDTKPNMF